MSYQRLGSASSSYGATDHRDDDEDDFATAIGRSEFDRIIQDVRDKILQVEKQTRDLENYGRRFNTSSMSDQIQSKISKTLRETKGVAMEAESLMKTLYELVRPGDKLKRMQADRVKSKFESTLRQFGEAQKRVVNLLKSAALINQPAAHDEEGDTWSEEANFVAQERRREQLQEQQLVVEDELAIARDREERITQIEKDVLDVNQIFKDLGTMVDDQGYIVNDIESNITSAADNVVEGNQQLTKAEKYQKSYRKKIVILMIIVLVVAGVVALIVGLSLKK